MGRHLTNHASISSARLSRRPASGLEHPAKPPSANKESGRLLPPHLGLLPRRVSVVEPGGVIRTIDKIWAWSISSLRSLMSSRKTMLSFTCRAKTQGQIRTITVFPAQCTAICDCDGFDGEICSHIDATLIAGERFMVPEEDRGIADQAMQVVSGYLSVPHYWRASWRRNRVWRGLSKPRRSSEDMRKQFGDDYYSRPKMCFTGSGPRRRNDLAAEAREQGWQVVNKPQKGIQLVVAEDPSGNSQKLKLAKQNAIPILSYEEWEDITVDSDKLYTQY